MAYQSTDNLNLNSTSTATDPLSVSDAKYAALQLSGGTGGVGSTVVTLYGSIDGAKYVTTGTTLTGEGITAAVDVTKYQWVRAVVTTAAGSTASGTISIITKKS